MGLRRALWCFGSLAGLSAALTILFLGMRGIFVAFVHVAWNSWMRDLIPQGILGRYYGRRQASSIAAAALVGLAGLSR